MDKNVCVTSSVFVDAATQDPWEIDKGPIPTDWDMQKSLFVSLKSKLASWWLEGVSCNLQPSEESVIYGNFRIFSIFSFKIGRCFIAKSGITPGFFERNSPEPSGNH